VLFNSRVLRRCGSMLRTNHNSVNTFYSISFHCVLKDSDARNYLHYILLHDRRKYLFKINFLLQNWKALIEHVVKNVFYKLILSLEFLIGIRVRRPLTLSLLMYIYGAPCKARKFKSYIYVDLRLATLKAVSFHLLHNVSTLNQC
jgi:hypothetical protein